MNTNPNPTEDELIFLAILFQIAKLKNTLSAMQKDLTKAITNSTLSLTKDETPKK